MPISQHCLNNKNPTPHTIL
jgi:hypothetical protein